MAKEKLKSSNIADVDMSATFIMDFVINCQSGFSLYEELPEDKYIKYNELIERRCLHEPLDSIVGFTPFYDLKIPFDKSVLTPRLETEFLVERVLLDIGSNSNLKILDMCCGSGCIGLSIAKATGLSITLVDISDNAINIAKNNAKLNNIQNISFVVSDLFDKIKDKYDIIVCNPPYIKTQDLNNLEIEVRDYDPQLALDGGEDGLDFYRKIADTCVNYLNQKGTLYLEIGYDQGRAVCDILKQNFDTELIQDLSHLDRFVVAKKRD